MLSDKTRISAIEKMYGCQYPHAETLNGFLPFSCLLDAEADGTWAVLSVRYTDQQGCCEMCNYEVAA